MLALLGATLGLQRSAPIHRRAQTTMVASAGSFISHVNTEYEVLHKSFEEQFW